MHTYICAYKHAHSRVHAYRMLARVQRQTLMTVRAFWQALLHDNVQFSTIIKSLEAMDTSAKRTDKIFRVMLDRYVWFFALGCSCSVW